MLTAAEKVFYCRVKSIEFFSPLDHRSSCITSKEDRSTDILIWVKLVSINVAL